MRFALSLALISLFFLTSFALGQAPAEPKAATGSTTAIDPQAKPLLEEINTRTPYQVPKLPLKIEQQYAHTVKELEPFHHVEPFKTYFRTQLEYTGPGRSLPEPADLKTVKIGFIGPLYPTVSVATGGKSHEEVLGKKMYQGCQLAIEEANARGGYLNRKLPFELAISNDNGLWGSSANEIIKQAYKDKAWAILGTIDGANSHIAIRVALKCEIFIMNTGDTDPTFIETNIPWVARCIGDDRQMNYILADYLYRKVGFRRAAIIRSSNRYGRFGVREMVDASRRLEHPIVVEMAYKVGRDDFSLELERVKQANADVVIHWGDDAEGAKILNQMRAMGMAQPFVSCDRCVSDEFVRIAGKNAEGVVCAFPWNPARNVPLYLDFCRRFRERFGEAPETYAAHAFDGMNMLIWAIQNAGLNRAKIRDLVAYRMEPWQGVTGEIRFSPALDDVGDVFLARRENGQWKYYSREDLGIPRTSQKSNPK
jgi:ABC-type branched-subunit amino acid transport system substrate-binding protein